MVVFTFKMVMRLIVKEQHNLRTENYTLVLL